MFSTIPLLLSCLMQKKVTQFLSFLLHCQQPQHFAFLKPTLAHTLACTPGLAFNPIAVLLLSAYLVSILATTLRFFHKPLSFHNFHHSHALIASQTDFVRLTSSSYCSNPIRSSTLSLLFRYITTLGFFRTAGRKVRRFSTWHYSAAAVFITASPAVKL